MDEENLDVFDSEEIIKHVIDPVHKKVKGMEKYERISKENKRFKYLLTGAYICAAKWYGSNRKFDLKEKITAIGENYIGLVFGLEDMEDGKFPDNPTGLKEMYDFLYDDEFVSDLRKNAREIYSVLTGNFNRPDMYL